MLLLVSRDAENAYNNPRVARLYRRHTRMSTLLNITIAGMVLALVLAMSVRAIADDKPAGVDKGDPAPSFESTDDNGKAWKSSDHFGKKIVVVYFYPADMTGGCTKQA